MLNYAPNYAPIFKIIFTFKKKLKMSYPYTFNLKEPNSDKKTLIYLRARIKNDDKYLKYSTGEKILPEYWDKKTSLPISISGKTKEGTENRQITSQLMRYAEEFTKICTTLEYMNIPIALDTILEELDKVFKKTQSIKNNFFKTIDLYVAEKKALGQWGNASIEKYTTLNKLLQEFQESEKYQISFNTINQRFYVLFVQFCRENKKHKDNTLGRYIGFFKTFMRWAETNKYHNNNAYSSFEKMSSETYEIALSSTELEKLIQHDFSENKKLERVRDVFVFGCTTGMRYSDYSKVCRDHVRNDVIYINTKKQKDNLEIPLNKISKSILEKYEYKLPLISDQKFRDYIKIACAEVGFTENVIKTSYIGAQRIDETIPKNKLVGTHTARRTFITLSLEKGMRPEVVMSISGHKDYKSFKKYIKLSQRVKHDEMQNAWK